MDILTNDALVAEIEATVSEDTNHKALDILNSTLNPRDKATKLAELVKTQESKVTSIINGLPHCVVFGDQLYEIPVKVTTSAKSESKYKPPAVGTKMRMEHDKKVGEIWIVTPDLKAKNAETNEIVSASKAVELFMTQTLGRILPEGFAGYPGWSHTWWVVVKDEPVKTK